MKGLNAIAVMDYKNSNLVGQGSPEFLEKTNKSNMMDKILEQHTMQLKHAKFSEDWKLRPTLNNK